MKKYIIIIILFSISIAFNIYFLCGKGIVINNNITNHQEQYQQQWQGQLFINQWVAQGNEIEWRVIQCSHNDINSNLNKLHPISSLYSKIISYDHAFKDDSFIIYPDIFTKTKEVQK